MIALWIIGTLGTLLLVEMQRRANQQMFSRQRLLEERCEARMDMQAQRLERLEQVDLGGAPYRRSASALRDIAIPNPPVTLREWNRRQRDMVRATSTPGPGVPRPS